MGKTCIVLRYTEGTFSESTNSTIGAFFLTKRMCGHALMRALA
ncbi:MAG: hypothetical protein ACK41Y_16285, partial [Paracoccus hibiscisoli]